MTNVYLTNTLSGKKEAFFPLDPVCVKMYVCGPTVYDRPHLGNARAAVVYDVLFRLLKQIYPQVIYARNITDVDDKIIDAVKKTGEPIESLTARMTDYYHADIGALNCLRPTHEPRARAYIEHMIKMAEALIKAGHAYVAHNHVLFAVESYKEYGKLSNRSVDEMIAGARVEVALFKKNPADFVLWKPVELAEHEFGFDSPWGRGRPGWHIECSAMSRDILGEVFDIHGGGIDLMFPHHENELAQSVCSSQSHDFVRYWVHNGFLMVNGEKMSKSLDNFKTVRDLLDEGYEGVIIRYLYLTTHYRKPLDFSDKALSDAQKAVDRFHKAAGLSGGDAKDTEFIEILADDLNTPQLLSLLHKYANDAIHGDAMAAAKVRNGCDLLGLDLNLAQKKLEIPQEITNLAEQRLEAKRNKDWQKADILRAKIIEQGFEIQDNPNGYKIIPGNTK